MRTCWAAAVSNVTEWSRVIRAAQAVLCRVVFFFATGTCMHSVGDAENHFFRTLKEWWKHSDCRPLWIMLLCLVLICSHVRFTLLVLQLTEHWFDWLISLLVFITHVTLIWPKTDWWLICPLGDRCKGNTWAFKSFFNILHSSPF